MINRRPRAMPVETTQPLTAQTGAQQTPPAELDVIVGVDRLMLTSLPPMASGADIYMRQFYRSSRLPLRRYLPLKGL